MPELPEVETVRRVLKKDIIGLRITKIESSYPQMVEGDFELFKSALIGQEFIDINRMGKYLIFKLNDVYLISHLRMEGKFFYQKEDEPLNKHIHMVISLDNGYQLRYQDTRKFGRMAIKLESDLICTPPLSKLALDANSTDFKPELLYNSLQRKKGTIKEALLNQEIISGLGNIYVDEVLASSKISPLRTANCITFDECKNILSASKEILDKAIIYKGTTIRSYTSSLGVKGEFQNFLLVHTKDKCPFCNNKIEKVKIGGRTTYFCKECQR